MADEGKTFTQAEVDDLVKGLKTKKTELEKDLAGLKTKVAQFDGIDLDALKQAQIDLEATKTKKMQDEGEWKKLHESLQNTTAAKLNEKESRISELESALKQTKKESAVNLGLAGIPLVEGEGISEAAAQLLVPKVEFTPDNEAMINGKPVTEFIKTDWAKSAVGKTFIRSGNSGGGSNGADGNKADGAEKYFDPKGDSYNLTEQGKVARSDPARYKALKEKYA